MKGRAINAIAVTGSLLLMTFTEGCGSKKAAKPANMKGMKM